MTQQKNADLNKSELVDDTPTVIVKRVLSENFHLYRFTYFLAILCMIAIAATTAFSAYIIKDVVNEVFDDKKLSAAFGLAGIVLLVFFIKGMAGFGQHVLLNRIGNNIVARYQKRLYEHMLNLGVGYYSDTRSAFLVGQINQNLSGIRQLLNQLITVFARDLLSFIGLFYVMILMDPYMTIGSILVMPIAGFVISRYVKKIKKLARQNVNVNSHVASSMIETAQGISVLKAFTMEEQMQNRVGSLINKAERQANGIALINARTKPLTETLGGIAIASAIAFGGYRVIELDGNNGAMLAFLAAAMLAYEPARRLASFRVGFEKSLVNVRMIYELLDTPPRQADKPNAKLAKITKGKIEFKNIKFAYGSGDKIGEQVLNDVSFIAESGKTTALVGPSGGGKTTLINLALRFHDLTSGTIKIDNQDISNIQVVGMRENMALVSQQPVLFEGSVADNIRFAKPDATQEQIEEAAKQAQAHDFILQMPQGYETPISEMGSNLSGGQRQRLSIARALLRNAKILLLDEATSALDNKSEKLVQHALDTLMKGRTTIVVAHRLSTIQNADKIVVIDRGNVVEQGNHKTLMRNKNGLYASLQMLGASTASITKSKKPAKRAKKTTTKAK
ncbi:MAG: ABC transporter ATP-binding protein [Rhizobiales bacterium]|nr:ABC transporter ATP-binding protein [Hyphomicrobiales bacterium]